MPELDRLSGKSRRFTSIASHFLFIVIIFILPDLMMNIARPHRQTFEFYPGFYLKTIIFITLFYVNYCIVIDRTIGRGGGRRAMLRFVLWNLLLMAGGLLLSELSRDVFGMPGRHGRHALFSVSFLVREAVMEILTIGLAVALRMSSLWQSADNQRQELLAEQRSTELDSLKSQLNPHFLFNTLNTIYALVDINPEDAKNAVHKLSGLLRYLLYEDVATVALNREIEFIKNYIELMRMRMSRHKMVLDIDIAGYESAPVPPLLLLPLVENAVKYGSSGRDSEPIRIAISISDGKLSCSTSNSFIPRSADERGSDRSSGIGLANLKRRLILLYGHAARLSIMTDGDIYTSNLLIPVNNE